MKINRLLSCLTFFFLLNTALIQSRSEAVGNGCINAITALRFEAKL